MIVPSVVEVLFNLTKALFDCNKWNSYFGNDKVVFPISKNIQVANKNPINKALINKDPINKDHINKDPIYKDPINKEKAN